MKTKAWKFAVVMGVLIGGLSACGGGDDDQAGQQSEFQASPDEVELASGDDFCPGPDALAADVHIIGGTAPYRVTSTVYPAIRFGAAGASAPTHEGSYTVSSRNGGVRVFVSGCLDMPVTVMDDLGRVVFVQVKAASGTGTADD
jgi:hypothetical protein